jgi:DNA-binding transcriptional LysR family regulator
LFQNNRRPRGSFPGHAAVHPHRRAGQLQPRRRKLDLPRASATQIIKQLEAHLGVRLLQRTTRQVRTTLDGDAYYQRCLAILADVEDVESSFSQAAGQPRGASRWICRCPSGGW